MSIYKKIFFLIFTLTIIIELNAQDYALPTLIPHQRTAPVSTDKRFSVGVSLGAAIPYGDFASTNTIPPGSFWNPNPMDSTKLQGFAKTGFNFTINASYLFTHTLGIMVEFGFGSNPFDITTFSNTIGYVANSPTAVFGEFEFLIGPFVSVPLSDKFKFNVSALIGEVSVTYPEIDIQIVDTTYSYNFTGGTGFAYNIGASLEYQATKSLSVCLEANYLASVITYSGYSETANCPGYYPAYYTSPTYSITMSMGLLKIMAGIALKL